uniref:Uncharacterized protein n=1 Tax=Rhizophora mucronata TaxID=61149 RepID=A0A2P2PJH1_RHIMU
MRSDLLEKENNTNNKIRDLQRQKIKFAKWVKKNLLILLASIPIPSP